MIGQLFNFRLNGRKFAAILASSVLLTAGCANMATTATEASSLGNAGALAGTVHGGNQPVSGATVQLFGVGQGGGPGGSATLFATTTTANDGFGSFQFVKSPNNTTSFPSTGNTYSCGTTSDPELYILVKGGNTLNNGQATSNSAAAFLAPVGYCSTVSAATQIDVTEVTTVATVASLAQFITPATDQISNDGNALSYRSIHAAFQGIPNSVNLQTGMASSGRTVAGNGANGTAGITMTITPNTAKINTIANIISSCVNQATATSGTACSTLFANATPPTPSLTDQPGGSFPAATDTVQAALYMFLNPTDGSTTNRTNLFNLVPAAGAPYQPTLTSVPTDWTLGVQYQSSNQCNNGSSSLGNYISNPYDIGIDVTGNVWLANTQSDGNSTLSSISGGSTPGSVQGAPMSCTLVGGQSKGGAQIDINGNVWYGDNNTNFIFKYVPSTNTLNKFATPAPVLAIFTDGAGSVFYSSTANGGSVYQIINAANFNGPSNLRATNIGPNPIRLATDTAGDIWVTSGAGYITELVQTAGAPGGYLATQYPAPSPTFGVIIGGDNRVYVTSQDPGNSISLFAPTGPNFSYQLQPGFPVANFTGGINSPGPIVMDSTENLYIGNMLPETSGLYSISVLTRNGAAISTSGTNGGYQKTPNFLNVPRAMVIDGSGNLWVTGDGQTNFVTEILGIAPPVIQPYSFALQNNRYQGIP